MSALLDSLSLADQSRATLAHLLDAGPSCNCAACRQVYVDRDAMERVAQHVATVDAYLKAIPLLERLAPVRFEVSL